MPRERARASNSAPPIDRGKGEPADPPFLARRARSRRKCEALFASPGPWPGTY